MSAAPATVLPAKLVVALLAGRAEWLDDAAERLRAAYGPTDVVSKVWPFDSTGYYASEMRADLLRQLGDRLLQVHAQGLGPAPLPRRIVPGLNGRHVWQPAR